jgi:hypothetical protein
MLWDLSGSNLYFHSVVSWCFLKIKNFGCSIWNVIDDVGRVALCLKAEACPIDTFRVPIPSRVEQDNQSASLNQAQIVFKLQYYINSAIFMIHLPYQSSKLLPLHNETQEKEGKVNLYSAWQIYSFYNYSYASCIQSN